MESLRILAATAQKSQGESFADVLSQRLDSLDIKRDVNVSVFEQYLLCCITCLEKYSQNKLDSNIGVLDIKSIQTVVEMIIFYGIYPNLTYFGRKIRAKCTVELQDKIPIKYCSQSCQVLLDFFKLPIELCAILSRKYSVDVYAGLLSLSTDSLLKNQLETCPNEAFLILNQVLRFIDETASKSLKSRVSSILSNLVIQHELLESTLLYFFPQEPSDQQIAFVCRLIYTVPSKVTQEIYYTHISNQIYKLMVKLNGEFKHLNRAIGHLSIQLMNRFNEFGKLVTTPLMKPLLEFYSDTTIQDEKDLNGNEIICNQQQLNISIGIIECLLLEKDPNKTVTCLLTPAIVPLLHLYSFLFDHNLSQLQSRVFNILVNYFGQSTSRDNRIVFEALLSQEYTSYYSIGSDRFAQMIREDCPFIKNEALFSIFDACPSATASFFIQALESCTDQFKALQLVLTMMEKYQQDILKSSDQVLEFLNTILRNPEFLDSQDEPILFISLSLLKNLLNQQQLNANLLNQVIENVSKFKDSELESIKELVHSILLLSSTCTTHNNLPIDSSLKSLNDALRDLSDEHLAVQAFGLVRIKSLIKTKDAVIDSRIESLLVLVLDSIQNDDSFVYLHAIQTLSEAALNFPKETLESITSRYCDNSRELDYRLRIGESLLITIQRSGELFLKYAPLIVPFIVKVLLDENENLKASAISLLTIVVQTSPFALLNSINQIQNYMHNALIFEKSVESRRAVLFFIVKFIESTKKVPVPVKVISEMIQDLIYVASTDQDQLTRQHAKDGLDIYHHSA